MLDGKKRLVVEGWRFIPHSFAIVNQWQILALLRRNDVALQVVDAPFYSPLWNAQAGLFAEADEKTLRAQPGAAQDAAGDVTLRLTYPFDFSLSRSHITAVLATAEGRSLRRASFREIPDLDRLRGNPRFRIVTPSTWSAQGFFGLGFGADQVLIVPHGADAATFAPRTAPMAALRAKLNLRTEDFVFLSVGAMSYFKGMDILLKAFAAALESIPQARLVLKGTDTIYESKRVLLECMNGLKPGERERVIANSRYVGIALSHRDMASLYQTADAYVSPYRCEGFNLPVLEAAACGIPLIVTGGGSTDDFVTDAFARRIASTIALHDQSPTKYIAAESGAPAGILALEPDLDHLVALMRATVRDEAWRRTAATAGAAHVRAHYGWDRVVDRLVKALWN